MTDENEIVEITNGAVPRAAAPGPARTPTVLAGGRDPFDLNQQQRLVLVLVLVVHVVLARLTLRDLRRRPESAVRGPKRLWRAWATLNTTGSVAYWIFGRRGGPTAPTA